jgi:RHS repeat-associated protein
VALETDALGHTVSYEYDAGDRLTDVVTDNPAERLYGTTCPLVTAHAHDDGDRITEARVYVPDDPDCSQEPATPLVAAFAAYDEIGNRTSLTDPNGHVTTYTYDLLDRLTSETDGLGTMAFTYDARDLITSRSTAAGDTIRYAYDAAGRLARIEFPGDGIEHVLDANGNRVSSRRDSASAPVDRSFDALDRMVGRTDEFGYTVGYEYDLAGNLKRLVYPSGVEVLYEYDRLSRLTKVTGWDGSETTYEYDVAGNLVGAALPDGSTVVYSYDAARRLTAIHDSRGGETRYRADYTLNAAGKRIAAELELPLEPDPATGHTGFTYGPANTLAARDGAAGASSYTHDADGNMVSGTLGGAPRTMGYNALDQMETHDGDAYRYDADGLRVEIARGDRARRFVYDVTAPYARLLEERDEQGNLVARYLYGLGLIVRDGPEGPRIYHYDSRGSTIALTDGSGTITDRYAYDPYGKLLSKVADVDLDGDGTPDPTENPFTFVGRDGVQDDGNGLYHMRARYYAPELGRFIQKDQAFDGTLTAPQSLNRYAYVQGDPIQWTDPNGEFVFFTALIVSIVVTAVIASAVNVAVECADADGCDAKDVFETIGESVLEAIPVVGTIYQGIEMGVKDQWDWTAFGLSAAGDVLSVAGGAASYLKAGAKAGKAAVKAGKLGKLAKRTRELGGKSSWIAKDLAKSAGKARRAALGWHALVAGDFGLQTAEIVYGGYRRSQQPTPHWEPSDQEENLSYCGAKCDEEERP